MPEFPHAKGTRVELEAGEPFFFKIEVQFMVSPLSVSLMISDLGIGLTCHNDVEIYVSSAECRPSAKKHEAKYMFMN